jgi:hypothetical protein
MLASARPDGRHHAPPRAGRRGRARPGRRGVGAVLPSLRRARRPAAGGRRLRRLRLGRHALRGRLLAPGGARPTALLAACMAAAGAGVRARTSRLGAAGLALLLGLALWTALSILWSEAPDRTWLQANRGLAYVLAAALGLVVGTSLPRALGRRRSGASPSPPRPGSSRSAGRSCPAWRSPACWTSTTPRCRPACARRSATPTRWPSSWRSGSRSRSSPGPIRTAPAASGFPRSPPAWSASASSG